MDIANYDPRVFQYERMTGDEKESYVKNMPANEKALFAKHLQDYRRRGWVKEAQGSF